MVFRTPLRAPRAAGPEAVENPAAVPYRIGARASLLALLACASSAGCREEAPAGAPNLLLISIDTLRPDHLGAYGYERETSPAIDRLAAQGVLFENHISSSSWTLPAHTAMFTSVVDSVHGVTDPQSTALPDSFTTLAERFRSAGYATGGFFSGPYLHPAFGLGQGFDHHENCTVRPEDPTITIARSGSRSRGDARIASRRHGSASAEASRKWIEEHDHRPFFAFVHFWDVHFDFVPPPPYDTMFDPDYSGPVDGKDFYFDNARYGPQIAPRDLAHVLALYDGEIRWTDGFIGKLMDDLDAWGIAENTIVVLTSDHGTEFFEHGWKCHRSTLFDELLRIPLVIRAPGRLPAGLRVAAQTRMIDLGPTLLALAGLAAPADVMGESLVALARGEPGDLDPVALAELDGDWSTLRCVRTHDAKLVQDLRKGSFAYYDLLTDPHELHPINDLSQGPPHDLARRYREAVDRIEKARAARPALPDKPPIAAELRRQLQQFGYVGD
jgi:arylsulfatase A-like enzyme